MGLSLQRLAQLCAMSESTETRVISNVNCRLLNYFKPSYDSKSSMILKEMGRVFTNWFCPPPAYEEELSDTRAEVQHALSSPDAGGRSRLLVSNRRLLQHSGTSRSGHCWAPEEFGTGHAPPAGSSQHPAALSSSELPCSRRSRAPGPELQDGIAQSNETRSVPCHRQKGDGVAAVTEEDRQYLKNQQLQSSLSCCTKGCSLCHDDDLMVRKRRGSKRCPVAYLRLWCLLLRYLVPLFKNVLHDTVLISSFAGSEWAPALQVSGCCHRNADSWSSSTSHCVLFLLCHLLWLPSSMPTCDRRVVFFSTLLSFLDN
nr:uncharacterized protein LOC110365253 isoform X4 [Columba livia]